MSIDALTPNQRLALKYIKPGLWFYPEESSDLIYVHNRYNTCRILAERQYLLKRVIDRSGYTEFEFMLPLATAIALNLDGDDGRTA